MKKLLVCLFISLFIFACAPAQETKSRHVITGTAAKGAIFPDGSPVELRSAPIPTGNQIIVGYYPNGDPDYQPETTPSEVKTATVSGGEGRYTIDVTGMTEPYLIRVQDLSSGKWYYSYADGESDTANVNPYSDWIVRYWYYSMSFDPDISFSSGIVTFLYGGIPASYIKCSYGFNNTEIIWNGMSLTIPDNSQIQRSMSELQYIINTRWLVDIGDVLTREWIIGESYDSILDGTTLDIAYIERQLSNTYVAYDMQEKGIAYYHDSNSKLHVEIYSIYPYCRVDWPGIGNIDMPITETIDGVNHYVYDSTVSSNPLDIVIRINNTPFLPSNQGIAYGLRTYEQ